MSTGPRTHSYEVKGNAREYIFKDQVHLKKYLYVLRPLLAIRHIEAGYGVPPVEFEILVASVAPKELGEGISTLLEIKRKTPELGLGEPIPAINRFITTELERHGNVFSGQGRPDILEKREIIHRLDEVFRTVVKQVPDGK